MLHPTRRLLLLAAMPAVTAVAAAAWPAALLPLLLADAVVLGLVLADAGIAWLAVRGLEAAQGGPTTWSAGRAERLAVELRNRGRLPAALQVLPDLPSAVAVEGGAAGLRLPGRARAELAFRCTAPRRGGIASAGVRISADGPLGLVRRTALLPAARTLRVYPDLRQVSDYEMLARLDRLEWIGVRRGRRAGGDTEFERLRDWRGGDPLSRMDWKATARREAFTVRDYRTSQAQRVVILVDAGRMMAAEAGPGGRTLLDAAIDAALLLAWVAVRQGDRVGLLAYADGVQRWVPCGGGRGQVARLVHALHDLHAERVESRHEEAFLHLDRHERKRSLVVAISHVLDEVNAGHLERHCTRLAGRHLPLAVLLRDPALHNHLPARGRLAEALAADPSALWRAGAAAGIIAWRRQVIERMKGAGALVLDAEAERLTPDLVSRYLEVKARHLL